MKKKKQSINLITCIIFTLVLSACSANKDKPECFDLEYIDFNESLAEWGISFQNVCRCVTDAVKYPEPKTSDFVIPYETIPSMSTCGLLVSLLEEPSIIALSPWITITSDHFDISVTFFNNSLRGNKMAVEFFNRSDFYSVLASKYLSVIKVKGFSFDAPMVNKKYISYIELLLSCDMSISALSEKEKIQLMAMALERIKYAAGLEFENNNTYYIMIAIMKSYKYIPFMEIDASNYHRDIIIEYANQFLYEQKL